MTRQFEVINDEVNLLLTSQQETILSLKEQHPSTNNEKANKNESLYALSLKRMVWWKLIFKFCSFLKQDIY